MLHFNCTYQQIWTYLILSAYLIGCLSVPVIEGLHFVLHLRDNTQLHSFRNHQTAHRHTTLALVDDLIDDSSSKLPTELPTKQKVKSFDQICQLHLLANQLPTTQPSRGYFYLARNYTLPFQPILAPPPQI